jgi:hypothetical protein
VEKEKTDLKKKEEEEKKKNNIFNKGAGFGGDQNVATEFLQKEFGKN